MKPLRPNRSEVPEPDVATAVSAYAQGLFPMDDPSRAGKPLPFYYANPRAIFEIDPAGLAALRRRVRRSAARDPGWTPAVDRDFAATLAGCMGHRAGGVWITERLARLYEALHAAGYAHSFELWDGDTLAAGVLGVVLRRAAMLESMFHVIPDSGNVCLLRALEGLAAGGVVLCDIQLANDHTISLGAREISAEEYNRRLAVALAP